jgi:hypothetical protein
LKEETLFSPKRKSITSDIAYDENLLKELASFLIKRKAFVREPIDRLRCGIFPWLFWSGIDDVTGVSTGCKMEQSQTDFLS